MTSRFSISQVVDPQELLALGGDWNRLSALTPSRPGGNRGSWDLSFPWALAWLSEIPEHRRDLLILTAYRDSKLRGILPLLIQENPRGRELTLVGAEGCFGDGKGILAIKEDQEVLGEVFGDYLANEWLGRLKRIFLHRVRKNDPGIQALVSCLVNHSGWSANSTPESCGRSVLRPQIGPDAEPMWPLSARRTMALVNKAFGSGKFEYFEVDEDTDKEKLIEQAFALRGMVKNDSGELRQAFGSIPMARRVLDYRFSSGTAESLSKLGRIGSCMLYWKNNPIGGALYTDLGNVRYVFWMEIRAHSHQEQFVFRMLLSRVIRSALAKGFEEVQFCEALEGNPLGIHNLAEDVCSIEAIPNLGVNAGGPGSTMIDQNSFAN